MTRGLHDVSEVKSRQWMERVESMVAAGLEWLLCGEALGSLFSGAMFSPEDICSPPGPVPPAAVSFAPARGQPLDHMEVCFLFLFVFFISRTDWEDLARVRTQWFAH